MIMLEAISVIRISLAWHMLCSYLHSFVHSQVASVYKIFVKTGRLVHLCMVQAHSNHEVNNIEGIASYISNALVVLQSTTTELVCNNIAN